MPTAQITLTPLLMFQACACERKRIDFDQSRSRMTPTANGRAEPRTFAWPPVPRTSVGRSVGRKIQALDQSGGKCRCRYCSGQPAFPAPSNINEGNARSKARAKHAARMRACVSPASLRGSVGLQQPCTLAPRVGRLSPQVGRGKRPGLPPGRRPKSPGPD